MIADSPVGEVREQDRVRSARRIWSWARDATAVAFIALVFGSTNVQAAGERGIEVRVRANEAVGSAVETVRLYGASHALVIGIDDYSNGWPRLSNGINDARAVAAELRSRGFRVTLRVDLDAIELKRAFEEFFIVSGADREARLFVWFSGHGATLGDEAFLVPADAPLPNAGPRFKLSALSLRRFGEFARLAESKHAFAVFDSCFAGTIFDVQRAALPAAITRATTLPVRQFLTSGDAGETVSDDGTFRKLFVRALRGEERSDANGDGYLTASELGMFPSDRMVNLRLGQTPRYGKLRDPNYDRGDFVFRTLASLGDEPAPAADLSAPASRHEPTERELDLTFWESVRDSKDAGMFEAYLERFPDGTFAALARHELEVLRQTSERPVVSEGSRERRRIESKETIGTLLGAVAGGVAGAQVGSGRGQLVATAIGTLLGAFLGNEIGKSLDRADQLRMRQAEQQALVAPLGETIAWSNPDSGNSGTVTAVRDGAHRDSGAYCREFVQTVIVGGRRENAYGTACRQPDGTWQILGG